MRSKNIQKYKIESSNKLETSLETTNNEIVPCPGCIDKDNCGGSVPFTKECLQFNYYGDELDEAIGAETLIPEDVFAKNLDPKILPMRTPLQVWRLCQYGNDLEVIVDMAASMPTGVSIKSFKVKGKKFYALYTLEYLDPKKPRKKKKGEQVSSHWF